MGRCVSALLEQALERGMEVRFGSRGQTLVGLSILVAGLRGADAIALGYLFETDMGDGLWLAMDDDLAPRAYAYLIVMHGRDTVSCMFSGLKQKRLYVERTAGWLGGLVGSKMDN